MSKHMQRLLTEVVVATAVFGVFAVVSDALGFNPVAATINALHTIAAWFAPWKLLVIAALVAAVPAAFGWREQNRIDAANRRPSRSHSYGYGDRKEVEDENAPTGNSNFRSACFAIAGVLVLAGFVMSVRSVNRWGHDVSHNQINQVLTVEENAATPTYETRDPYDLAIARLNRSVGDSSGYKVPEDNVWRFEVDGEPQTCGLKLSTRNAFHRPMGVFGVVCVSDSNKVVDQEFDKDVPSWEVAFGSKRLTAHVNDAFPRGRFVETDVYGYIDETGPHMVVPVTRMTGGLGFHEGWVGALVFDADGTSRKVTDPAELPGPAIGESVADYVLNALSHRGRFMQSKLAQVAYDLGEGQNVKHFLLERTEGAGERLVTLLTPMGTSETVSAVLEIDPHTVVDGWPTATLYRLDTRNEDGTSRASVAEVVDLVKQRYGTAMQLGESQHGVMEATPADADELVVTVGSNQRVFARVSVDMMTRATCVYAPNGEEVQCDSPDSAPLALGQLSGLFNSGTTAEAPPKGTADGGSTEKSVPPDISNLSDAELTDLLRQVASELDKRREVPQQSS